MEIANCIYGKGRRYVPYIYMDKQRVGGYGELYEMHKEGVVRPPTVAPTTAQL